MPREFLWRVRILQYLFGVVFLVFAGRLFQLQVIEHDEWYAEAKSQHEKRSVLPARRGKILVRKNRLTDDVTPLATNNTLKMLFIDPIVLTYPRYNPRIPLSQQASTGSPQLTAELLAPLLIHAHCEKIEGCLITTDRNEWSPTEEAAINAYQRELENIFSETERHRVILETELTDSRMEEIRLLHLGGIFIEGTTLFADPTKIVPSNIDDIAEKLTELITLNKKQIARALARRPKRYVEIVHKIVPEVSAAILELKKDERYRDLLRGIQLRNEHWRYYPEKALASQVLGFLDSSEKGQYGLEGYFEYELKGQEGVISGATNVRGQRILDKGSDIQRAQDGADLVISIDRVIQGQIERILSEDLKKVDADFGQVIVVEPATGRILAMAQAPTFDPNEFGKAFARYEISEEQELADREDETFNQRIPTITSKGKYYRYFNHWGPQVFRNKIISDTYEPGSVMKAVTIAAALNADEIKPTTTFNDIGPIEVDEFQIRNSGDDYHGQTTMIKVLTESLNTGIAFITQKMGAKLLYEYLQKFGFEGYTGIELSGEVGGKLEHWKDWEASELITRGFGQGMTATPLQMTMAFAALANGGHLMKPLLVEEIRYPDGKVKKIAPETIRKVISNQTYQMIKSMLLASVNDGIAWGVQIRGYNIMGKTGTSQTYRNGKALTGVGTTITSFAGFAPLKHPQFVVLTKYDFPKTSQWGSETAAGTFRRVTAFLLEHMGIPPDRK